MTDFDAATAQRGFRTLAVTLVLGLAGAGLAGCGTTDSLFGSGATAMNEPPPPAAVQPKMLAKVALAPIIGAPEGVAKQLTAQLGQSGERQRITMLTDRDAKADYTLRGYIVAARDKAGTKVSYIWDVADQSGKRVNRISGEEIVAGTAGGKDPWAGVTAAVTQTIADKTASSLGAWIPSQNGAQAVAAAPPAATPPTAAPAAAGAGAGAVPPLPAQAQARAPAASNTTTAALPRGDEVAAVVPQVTGAPGDGNDALSTALQRELSRQGIALVEKPGTSYRVEGKVVMGQTKDGKQPIQIDWRVKDPQGKSLGTVSQKNEIPPGSLDGSWGKTAEAAAAAAAQGIVKLLPQSKSTN